MNILLLIDRIAWSGALGMVIVALGYTVTLLVISRRPPRRSADGRRGALDYQLNWKIMKDATLTFGYSVMFGTKTMDAVKGGNHKSWQDWGWISLNLTPKLFSAKW